MKRMLLGLILLVLVLSQTFSFHESSAAASPAAVTFRRPIDGGSITCVFDSTDCGAVGKYHTGIDYGTSNNKATDILASECGVVTTIQRNGANDHGMGNAVILKHYVIVSNSGATDVYYTLYAHMDSITSTLKEGQAVSQGTKLGVMGGTGFGSRTTWRPHLHFEVKTKDTLGNPSTPPRTSGSFWGYTKSSALGYGYLNPANFIGSRRALCATPSR